MSATERRGEMKPFYFHTRVTQVELLGRSAKNVHQLLEGIRSVPAMSIYHHTHKFLEQHCHFSPEHPNDFSYWVNTSLGLKRLGEIIASVNLFGYPDMEDLRRQFVEILQDYIAKTLAVRNCIPGEEFTFLSSRIFILPTKYSAKTLAQFINCLKRVTIHSLYFHMFESRLRLKKGDNDFSLWLKDAGYLELSRDITRLDPYTHTLQGLRNKIIQMAKKYL